MIFIFIILFIMASIILSACLFSKKNNREENIIAYSIIATIIGLALIFMPSAVSYSNYLDIKADYYGVVAQYESAINIYGDKAIIDIDQISFTDFKYEGYQKEMASLIRDLRHKIENYNTTYIKKKTMDNNLMFNWLIVAPDSGMKLLQMTQKNFPNKKE